MPSADRGAPPDPASSAADLNSPRRSPTKLAEARDRTGRAGRKSGTFSGIDGGAADLPACSGVNQVVKLRGDVIALGQGSGFTALTCYCDSATHVLVGALEQSDTPELCGNSPIETEAPTEPAYRLRKIPCPTAQTSVAFPATAIADCSPWLSAGSASLIPAAKARWPMRVRPVTT